MLVSTATPSGGSGTYTSYPSKKQSIKMREKFFQTVTVENVNYPRIYHAKNDCSHLCSSKEIRIFEYNPNGLPICLY